MKFVWKVTFIIVVRDEAERRILDISAKPRLVVMDHLMTALPQLQQDWLNRVVHAKVRDMKKQYLHTGFYSKKASHLVLRK